jgi:hypothetical protein
MKAPLVFFELDGKQKMLLEALASRSIELGKMYEGAVRVFNSENPDRIHLACHGLRELMNELPKYVDLVIPDESRQRLGDFAAKLKGSYEALLRKTSWPGDPKWSGEIDEQLRGFLMEAETFLEADGKIKKSRADVTRDLIQKHNHSVAPLPTAIEGLRVKEWQTYNSYFTGVAHHATTTEAEFLGHLGAFEDMLLHFIRPQTFERRKDILAAISEGESNAN